MDKSSDSSSDSDSNSSTSWVFVNDVKIPHQVAANTFHLDCSREPIQELTEQDLLSASSDFESDTDGISVISESEIPAEDPCANIQPTSFSNDGLEIEESETSLIHNDDTIQNEGDEIPASEIPPSNEVSTKIELTKILKPLHVFGIGFVVTAVFLASYSNFMTKIGNGNEEHSDVPSYKKKVDEAAIHDKYKRSCDNLRLYEAKVDLNEYEYLQQIVDITMTCAYRHKPKNDLVDNQIKRCVRKEYETRKAGCLQYELLGSEENYNKYIFNREEILLKKRVKKNLDVNCNDDVKQKYKKNEMGNEKNKNDRSFCNIVSEDHIPNKIKKKDKETKDKMEKLSKIKNEKNVIKLKYNKKNHNSQEKFKGKHQIPTNKPYKHEKDKRNDKNKKHSYINKKKYDHKLAHKNFNKMNAEIFVKYKDEDNEYHFKEIPNKNAKTKESKYRNKMTHQKRNGTASGEWYTNLHKARNQIRKQHHISDWVFDRANIRSKRRNKAQWYFKWMNVREQLRYKQSYKPYSS